MYFVFMLYITLINDCVCRYVVGRTRVVLLNYSDFFMTRVKVNLKFFFIILIWLVLFLHVTVTNFCLQIISLLSTGRGPCLWPVGEGMVAWTLPHLSFGKCSEFHTATSTYDE